jgi:hypothetical protein
VCALSIPAPEPETEALRDFTKRLDTQLLRVIKTCQYYGNVYVHWLLSSSTRPNLVFDRGLWRERD